MHLVWAEVCSLRICRQTRAWCMPQTPQKRWNGKAPCLGGQQETIIQHMEIVKQRGQVFSLTPLFFLCLILYQGNLAKSIYFLSGFPAHRAKALYPPNAHIEQSDLDIRLGGSCKPPASPSLLLDAREATGFPAAISPAASPAVSGNMAAQSPEG